ncbi:ataxin-2 homolog isoform X3 [Oreochromis niloticus]|uniref:ataxin-2 homolog isoform X3 n=1 Tax=Oreochromis niloticus TaxID=8128 RepID=UPI000DF1CF1D|nr:ataxin-2 homolog isoform X3 [Oreochromis niloticus]
MASGFLRYSRFVDILTLLNTHCISRVLLLSLLAFSKHAESLTYRSTYSSGIKPYSGMAENFPHNQNPVFRHKSYAQPRSSLGVYGPEHGSPENSYPTAAGMPGGAGASSGGPLNGYHQQGSMSSYRSGSSHYQGDTDGALQSKDAMWGLASPQKRNRIDTGIVSSYPIEMRSVPQWQSNEHQTQPHPEREQFSDFQSRPLPQQPRYEASKPQARPFPQQPRYEASKPQARPFPQQPRYEASKPQAHPRSEANSPSEDVLQNKASMWDLAINSNADPRSLRPIQVSSSYLYSWPQQQAPFYNRY